MSAFKLSPATLKKQVTFTFNLSEAARAVITVTKRGMKPVRISFDAVAGKNAKKLKRGKLSKGTYVATVVATDAAGKKSAPGRITFRVA